MKQSEVEIDICEVELALYLVSTMTQEEIDDEGWSECCHSRLNKGPRRPGITTKEIVGDRSDGNSLWRPPIRRPTQEEKRGMERDRKGSRSKGNLDVVRMYNRAEHRGGMFSC